MEKRARNNREMISLEEAVTRLTSEVKMMSGQVMVPLSEALGRCAAQDLCALVSQPPFSRSPLDGYAVRAEDTSGACEENPVWLNVIDKIYAGEESSRKVGQMETVRLMTGSPIPEGADTVIRQEDVIDAGEKIGITGQAKAYENYCRTGEDFKEGECLIRTGERMDAIRIGIAASMGYEKIPVNRIPKAAVLATGNEIQKPGSPLLPGKIYDTNLYTVSQRLRELGVNPVMVQQVPDEKRALLQAVAEAAEKAEIVITTGGVSVGEKDLMPEVMEALGAKILFHGVRVKPGSPVLAAVYDEKPVVCLSGNPFGALVHLELVVRPVLAEMTGDTGFLLPGKRGEMLCSFQKKSPGRRMVRAVYEDGYVTLPEGLHASGVLSSMIGCNCLIDIEAGNQGLEKGDIVCVKML